MMDFIHGVSLSDLLQDPNAERPSRAMRDDIKLYIQAVGEFPVPAAQAWL